VEAIIRKGLPAQTPHTLTSADCLRAELDSIRSHGFAVDDQENEIGVRCAGAPVFDYTGAVVGAISVSGPASRITWGRSVQLGPLVRDAALEVSKRIGYQPQAEGKRKHGTPAAGEMAKMEGET
jgi:DNA-binding IclR family transcriptional regulator